MGPFLRALAAVGLAAALLPATAAAAPRTWGSPRAFPGPVDPATVIAPLPGGGSLVVDHAVGGVLVARTTDAAGDIGGPTQVLGGDTWAQASLATDATGAAVIAFADPDTWSVVVITRAADGTLSPPATFRSNAQATPVVAVSPDGWAAVAFAVVDANGQRVGVIVRPPGGSFGPIETPTAAPPANSLGQVAGGLAINDSGTIVLGYQEAGIAGVVVGESGAWQPQVSLGAPPTGLYTTDSLPEVGIDAAGGAVVVWLEGRAGDQVEPARAAFRPAGGSFGPPQDLLDTWAGGGPSLAVSALGEAIVLVTPAVEVDDQISLQPFAVLSGSTVLGRFGPPQRLSYDTEDWPGQLTMNARGDAVAAWVRCCPGVVETHRRAPFGPFEPAQVVAMPPTATAFTAGQLGPVAVDPFGNATLEWIDHPTWNTDEQSAAADAPVLSAAPPVAAPTPLALTNLVPVPVTAPYTPYEPFWWPLPPLASPAPDPTPPVSRAIPARRSPVDVGSLTVAVPRLPGAAGQPRIVVAVHCPWACRASISATLITPAHRRLSLPLVALTADAPGVVSAALRLSPAAARALHVPAARAAAKRPAPRRFTLSLTVTAGDRNGARHAVSLTAGFRRR